MRARGRGGALCGVALLMLAVEAAPAPAPRPAGDGTPVLLTAASLLLSDGTLLPDGAIRIDGGVIRAVGRREDLEAAGIPSGARRVDLEGRTIAPSFVSPLARTGCERTADEAATSITPELDAVEALDPWSDALATAARGGLLVLGIGPGPRNVLGGWIGAIAPGPGPRDPEILERRAALRGSLAASRFIPVRQPTSRPDAVSILRTALRIGRAPDRQSDPKARAVAAVARGERPLLLEARTPGEIDAALHLFAAFALRGALVGANGALERLDAIRAGHVAVVLDPLRPGDPARKLRLPSALEAHDIPFAFAADTPEELRWSIAIARRFGASRRTVLAAATSVPARLLGIGDRVGAIAAGRRADLVVFDGDPLALASRVVSVYREGRPLREMEP